MRGPTPPPGNRAPVLAPIGDRQARVGREHRVVLVAWDPDDDALSFRVDALPDGARFDPDDGELSWVPGAEQLGTRTATTFEVSDGRLAARETVWITVVPVDVANAGPVQEIVGDHALEVGVHFRLRLAATDADGDALAWRRSGDELPGEPALDPDTGVFDWTPPPEAEGNAYTARFVVSDGVAEEMQDVRLVVRPGAGAELNLPPRIDPIADLEVEPGVAVRIQVTAQDDDPASLEFAVSGALPPGAVFDADTALFTWTPAAEHANRAFGVVFQVSDGEFRAIERVLIQVADGPAAPCEPDDAEANEPTALVDGQRVEGRSVCPEGDTDTFTIEVPAGSRVTLQLSFAHADGDLDMHARDPGGVRVARSASARDGETVRFDSVEGGRYTAEVFGFRDATNPSYVLDVMIEEDVDVEPCVDDALQNNEAGAAADLRAHLGEDLRICPGVDDFFFVDLEVGTSVTIDAAFEHAAGDIDLRLTGPDGFRRVSSSSSDNERLDIDPVPATGRYSLHVYGFRDAENTYRIELAARPAPACDPDRVEPNDTRDTAARLPPNLYRNLTWCGDADWFETEVAAGAMLDVYLSHTGRAPAMEAFTPAGDRIAPQEYAAGDPRECQDREGCRRLSVTSPGGFVHYVVRAGERGQAYDLDVEVGEGVGGCARENQVCDILDVCDYMSGECAEAFCDRNGVGCPPGYACVQEWCVEPCGEGGACGHRDHVCKRLDGRELCGVRGVRGLGASCFDFSDCEGSFDCLVSAPNGYCTRSCADQATCGADGACVVFPEGPLCANHCAGIGDCRNDYSCSMGALVDGGQARVCTPGIEI